MSLQYERSLPLVKLPPSGADALLTASVVLTTPFLRELNQMLRTRMAEFGASSRQTEILIDEVMLAAEKYAIPFEPKDEEAADETQ